jgi:hypothetical protein
MQFKSSAMKKNIFLALCFLSIWACSAKKAQVEMIPVSVDSLLANPAMFVEKGLILAGTVSHVCRHGGQKMFLFGTNPDQFIQINVGTGMTEFDVALEGTMVEVEGMFKELRIDEDYVANLESETEEVDPLSEEADSDSLAIHKHEQQIQNSAYLRKQIEESGKGYFSEYWIEALKFHPKSQ